MKTKSISRKAFLAAQYTVESINPAIAALEKINKQAIGNEEQFLEVLAFDRFLKKIRDSNLAVLDRGTAQYESRDVDLINAAAARLNQIPREIELEQKQIAHMLSAREFKVASLKKQSFIDDEIERITPPIPQSVIDTSNGVVARLNAEHKAILKFLNDGPRFDVSLLVGTSLEQIEVLS
jgi:hypothetical protein